MITLGPLREFLIRPPFRRFRVYVSDGSHHDIPHPEFAWPVGSRFYVAKIVNGRGPDDPQVDEPLARGGAKK